LFANGFLVEGDAVVTLNYDMAIDRELRRSGKWSIGNGYGFEVNSARFGESPCKLLKLHGSTNWRGEPFQGMEGFGQINSSPLGERPVIDSSEFEYLGYPNGSDPKCHDGRVRIESLIMPTAEKRFYNQTSSGREWEAFWDSLWAQAAESLYDSEEIYLIGYSVPEYDTRARELLRQKIRADIPVRVCCHSGTDDVVRSLKSLGIRGAEPARKPTFEGLMRV
jgi:hypothetical protein